MVTFADIFFSYIMARGTVLYDVWYHWPVEYSHDMYSQIK